VTSREALNWSAEESTMPITVLILATGEAADAPVFATALAVARRFDSHLCFLHVRPDVRQEISSLAAPEVGVFVGVGDTMDRLERDADQRERTAERAWRELCAREGIAIRSAPPAVGLSAEWQSEIGAESAWIAAYGRVADLIVVGRARTGRGVAMEVLEAALMDTGRPVLIAPSEVAASVGRIVTIAWKDTPEAASAVAAARGFIREAERVVIMTVEEEPDSDDHSGKRLQRALRWYNPRVLLRRLTREPRAPVETLLEAAVRVESDLLVMGGYGHTRLREAVFGGFTRRVLEHAALPVLMSH
jgi:nucleotide-binding universal stress UspA family protein